MQRPNDFDHSPRVQRWWTKFFLAASASLALAACTKPNPAVCCVSAEDCSSIGVSDTSRDCAPGLTCQDHSCAEPSCTTSADCSGNTPVCTNGACVACDAQNACPMSEVCQTSSGACVGCLTDADCSATDPVCDTGTNSCRTCALDSECASGACADDGTCVPEANIAYVDPSGSDTGNCDKTVPCRSISAAALKTNDVRTHIVVAQATYGAPVFVAGTATTATHMIVHGGNAAVQCSVQLDGTCFEIVKSVTIKDLTVNAPGGDGVTFGGTDPSTLENVSITSGKRGLIPGTLTTLKNVSISAMLFGILLADGDSLTFDRGTIIGGQSAITATSGTPTIELSNVLIYGTALAAISLKFGLGTISFCTIADSGAGATDASGVLGSSGMTIRSSIIWNPAGTVVPVSGADLVTSIVGPMAISGSSHADPMFVDETNHDYHLASGSPAIDQAATGPATDLDGTSRPQGAGFDLGAYEAKP